MYRLVIVIPALFILCLAGSFFTDTAFGGEKQYVPEPTMPESNGYDIGVYYYPGWQAYSNWSVLDNYPERKPLLGYYREGEQEVADWHLKWAAEHGISFFIYDWYWEKGNRQLQHALHRGYFNARYNTKVKFALLWANHNQPGTSSEEDLVEVTKYWIENYFRRPDYYTVNGKPVVIIFSPDRLTQDMGADNVKTALTKMRNLVKEAGLPDIYLMACTSPGVQRLKILKDEGYDAATGYNYPSAGAENKNSSPYDLAVTGYERIWKQIADSKQLDYVPVTDPGWDSRPWHGDNALVRTDRTPEKFKLMLEKAKAFVDSRTPAGRPKIVLVEAWNEFGEGAAIEPSNEWGFGYLDAIRSIFTKAAEPHTDLTPADVGLGPYELTPPPPVFYWEFNDDGDTMGWGSQWLNDVTAADGALVGTASGNDPGFYSPLFKLNAEERPILTIKMKMDKGTQAQIFWSTEDSSMCEELSEKFLVEADDAYHIYRFDLGENPGWSGVITRLRIDPNSVSGSNISIAFVSLSRPIEED